MLKADTVVTCFPGIFDPNDQGSEFHASDIYESVLRDLQTGTKHGSSASNAAFDLALRIVEKASGVFFSRDLAYDLQFLYMFENTITDIVSIVARQLRSIQALTRS